MKIEYPYMPAGKHLNYVGVDDSHMLSAKAIYDKSSCTKHPTGAVIVKDGKIIAQGSNAGKKQEICYRWGSPTGTNYGPCKEMCEQKGHAEVSAVEDAKNKGVDTNGGDLYLYGHWWCCENCWNTMISAGIENVFVLENSWNLFNPEINKDMKNWGKPRSFIYFDENVKKSEKVRSDVDFLLGLIESEGRKKKRWEIYLEKGENVPEDGNVFDHSATMENISYFMALDEGLTDDQRNKIVWTARLHDLGELKYGDKTYNLKDDIDDEVEAEHIEKIVTTKLKTEYAKEKIAEVLDIALHKNHKMKDGFDYVEFFNALERIGYLQTALNLSENQAIANWQVLFSNVFFNQSEKLIDYARKYKSIKEYLIKREENIKGTVEKYFSAKYAQLSFEKIYGNGEEKYLKKEKGVDVSEEKIEDIKKKWKIFFEL